MRPYGLEAGHDIGHPQTTKEPCGLRRLKEEGNHGRKEIAFATLQDFDAVPPLIKTAELLDTYFVDA